MDQHRTHRALLAATKSGCAFADACWPKPTVVEMPTMCDNASATMVTAKTTRDRVRRGWGGWDIGIGRVVKPSVQNGSEGMDGGGGRGNFVRRENKKTDNRIFENLIPIGLS